MDHPKCKTCKHFRPEGEGWDRVPEFGDCTLVSQSWDMTIFDRGSEKQELRPEFEGHMAAVRDGSSYMAVLQCSPEFYCPMHSDLKPDLESATWRGKE